jgi:glycosyltransferase involved in cell wall biosynthesis
MSQLLCINTGGIGDLHGLRARRLTKFLDAECTYFDVDESISRRHNAEAIRELIHSADWDLIYQEGTGIAGGLNLIRSSLFRNQPYIVSSGDPIGEFFHVVKGPLYGFAFEQYEKLLYGQSAGFIGWTPYLAGMAMKMGAPRAVTVEGAVDMSIFSSYSSAERAAAKKAYGLDSDHVVCGVVGSLKWTPRQQYCYGLELVAMLPYLNRQDVSILIVGDGDGREHLQRRVPDVWRDRVVFTGRVPEDEVVRTLNAMDVGFIAQTLDKLGRYRLTTKLPEYLASGLPVAMSPVPGFFDYAHAAGWALPPHHPASEPFHRKCAAWIDRLSWSEIKERRQAAPSIARTRFAYEIVRPRFEAFIKSLLESAEP